MKRTPVISLGAGVQSTTMALMAAEGAFGPCPELAIFADTMREPRAVYDQLIWLMKQVKFEIATVREGDLLKVATSRGFNPIPLYMDDDGAASAGRRQCTKEFKLYPIRRELRRRKLDHVEMWVGISIDEVERMKPANVQWIKNRWPLVEAEMTRVDCQRWLEDRGYPIPAKSACYFCPYKRERDFAQMRENDPESFALAVEADEQMRDAGDGRKQYVLASLKPLSEATSLEDEGQQTLDFGDECEGMCGV